MSKGDWLHRIAVGGVLIALAFLPSKGEAQGNPAPQPTQTQQQPQTPTPAPVVQQPVSEPGYYKISCEHPKEREDADLCEQRRQAQAAEDAVWWAKAQTALGVFGAVLVLASLWFTGSAAVAASRAAKAAELTLHGDRPWLCFVKTVSYQVTGEREGAKYINGIGFILHVENLGNTPALRAGLYVETRAVPFADPIPIFHPAFDTDERSMLLGPRQQLSTKLVTFNDEDSDAFRSGKRALYVFLATRYRDRFSPEEKQTQYCMRVALAGINETHDGLKSPMYSLVPMGPQNTAT